MTKPEQVPHVRNGEQIVHSPSLWSWGLLFAYSVSISLLQLLSKQQGTVESKIIKKDSMKQRVFIDANIVNFSRTLYCGFKLTVY